MRGSLYTQNTLLYTELATLYRWAVQIAYEPLCQSGRALPSAVSTPELGTCT